MMAYLIGILWLMADPGTVIVDRGIVRQGPGTIYPVVVELGRGAELTIVSEDDGWMNVRAGSVSGFISSRAVGKGVARNERPSRRTASVPDPKEERRRIAREAARTLGVAESQLSLLDRNLPDPERYQRFKAETYPRGQRASSYRRDYRLPALDNGMLFYPLQEEGAGWAIAGGLASRGLYRSTELEEYVAFIGHMVAEASHGYDLGFRFFILDDEVRESYSTPGGFIFVTKGLLRQLETEAELAAVLAHEIAHVTQRHGLKELANTRNVAAADAAFRELDGTVERTEQERQTAQSINDELITYRERMYSMRNQDFERAADATALFYLARAGYSPQGLANLVMRLMNNIPAGAPPYQAHELMNRYEALQKEMAGGRWRGNLMQNPERYLDMRRRIR